MGVAACHCLLLLRGEILDEPGGRASRSTGGLSNSGKACSIEALQRRRLRRQWSGRALSGRPRPSRAGSRGDGSGCPGGWDATTQHEVRPVVPSFSVRRSPATPPRQVEPDDHHWARELEQQGSLLACVGAGRSRGTDRGTRLRSPPARLASRRASSRVCIRERLFRSGSTHVAREWMLPLKVLERKAADQLNRSCRRTRGRAERPAGAAAGALVGGRTARGIHGECPVKPSFAVLNALRW